MGGLIHSLAGVIVAVAVFSAALPRCGVAADSSAVLELFTDPPRQYSTAPLWVWNDMLTEQQIVSTLEDLAGQNVRQVFVHPRPGLMTPYLSPQWFRLWKVALEEAKRLDMNVWIYDENSYPSGFAGGLVPEAMPESRTCNLFIEPWEDVVAVFARGGDSYQCLTSKPDPGGADCLVAFLRWSKYSAWHGGRYYVNLLTPGVTEKFLEITLDPYARQFGDEFGKRVPGVFTDEPRLRSPSGLPWAKDLPEQFEKRWGYSLMENLPSLVRPVGDWKRVRHNYFQLVLELFLQRWARPYYRYCDKHNLLFTGHYWEHEWPRARSVPDSMAAEAWQHQPGIDILMNRYSEDVRAQFGNVRSVKEVSSVANQLGRKRVLCEAFGAGGWDLRFEDMKRIGDWLYVHGVNLLDEHLSFVTIRGARKRDHPQSFSYHEPWWDCYHVLASYFTRLSAVLSQGQQVNTILLLEPTTTAWMYQPDSSHRNHLESIGGQFQKMVVDFAKAQVEYDIGCENIIADHGAVEGARLRVGNRRYETVVLGPLTENLNGKTMELLEGFVEAGGKVLCCGEPPSLVDGVRSDRGKLLSRRANWRQVEPDDIAEMLSAESKDGFAIHISRGSGGILYHHRRQLDDGEILFLVNTSIDSAVAGVIQSPMRGIQKWDPRTGSVSPYKFSRAATGVEAEFDLPACGSLLLFLSREAGPAAGRDSTTTVELRPAGAIQIRRTQPNVLTLDYVDVSVGGETRKNIYFYEASKLVWQKHGFESNPWDSAVQFRDELISKKFPADSGFEATYRFRIEARVPEPLYIVIERSDLYTITCNGKPVSAQGGQWWLDKAFGKVDVTDAARVGENVVTIKACPMTMYHELEPAYVLGEFSLRPTERGFVIGPNVPLEVGPWNEQGCPFYASGVSYSQVFDVGRVKGKYVVSLGDWYGSVAKVAVNGKPAGCIYCRPWRLDVTDFIVEGENRIDVTVIGTLYNTLGPHHGNQPLGTAWPSMFRKAPQIGPPPGKDYQSIGYGLFRPFTLSNSRRR